MTSTLIRRLLVLPRRSKVLLMVATDVIVLPLCFSLALLLRRGDAELLIQYGALPPLTIAALTIPVLYLSGLYRTVVRYIDIKVLWLSGISLATLIALTYFVSLSIQQEYLPRTGLLIYWFIAFSYVVISRFLARTLLRTSLYHKNRGNLTRLAILGAGEAGAQLAQAMHASAGHKVLCFFDHDGTLNNTTVGGLPVYGVDRITEQISSCASMRSCWPFRPPHRRAAARCSRACAGFRSRCVRCRPCSSWWMDGSRRSRSARSASRICSDATPFRPTRRSSPSASISGWSW